MHWNPLPVVAQRVFAGAEQRRIMTQDKVHTSSLRRDVILREATRLFREKGYRSSTLRELAKRSGVQGGSIYHHFSSKEEILFEIMNHTMTELILGLREVLKGLHDPVEKLHNATRFHIEYHINNLDETYVSDAELRSLTKAKHDSIMTQRRDYETIFVRILEEGIRQGVMNIDNVKLASMAMLQMCTGVSYWFRKDGPLNIHEIADVYVNFICYGVMCNS